MHLVNDRHAKRTALQAVAALDARRGLDREISVPPRDLLQLSAQQLIQVPDHPADLDPLGTREAVMAVVDKKDTSQQV